MSDIVIRHPRRFFAAVTALAICTAVLIALLSAGTAKGANLGQLENELGATQSSEQSLSSSISALNDQVTTLGNQISLVQSRATAAQTTLVNDRAALAENAANLRAERAKLATEKQHLALAQKILSRQLRSQYEQPQQSLIQVLLQAHGFQQMLDQIQFLTSAKKQQQAIIAITRAAKAATEQATHRVSALVAADEQATARATQQADAIDGMQTLLNSREDALAHARAAQQDALAASKSHGAALQSQIGTIEAQEAAAQKAAAALAAQQAAAAAAAQQQASGSSGTSSGSGGTSSAGSGAYDGWAIPYSIVLCESGGQNLPPNSAGASGYYQIMPATWSGYGGTGPAAYLASEAEQSAIAAKIWNGGAGASNWVCAGIVGIT